MYGGVDRPDPVSYTHLDVYKRQIWLFMAGMLRLSICIALHSLAATASITRKTRLSAVISLLLSVRAVSYTHLDVYKRQPYLTVRRAWPTEHNRPVILTELQTKAAHRNVPLQDNLLELSLIHI